LTKVRIRPGICGFNTVVIAEREKKKVRLTIVTDCDMVRAMAEELNELDMVVSFTGFINNPVYRAASKHLRHVTCPVPCGILKALEVEAGLALPRDVSIEFISSAREEKDGISP
jgi:hypothetical protein